MEFGGKNAFGRRISFLNDSQEAKVPARGAVVGVAGIHGGSTSLAYRTSRTSSYDSSSHNSTSSPPELSRSNSSDSSDMDRNTPSPITPSFIDFAGLQPADSKGDGFAQQSTPGFFNVVDPQYPQIPQQFNYQQGPQAIAPQPQVQGLPGPSSISDQTSSKGPAPKQQTKKNSYPCPLAKQYNCQDHFTTSGHAARHAKKHTGKKDAFCPECNKAFTRKDNMEQHRRTHQNGRNAAKSGSGGESAPKRQRTSKRNSTAGTSSEQAATADMALQTSMPASNMLDPSLAHSPASSFGFSDHAFASGLNMMQQYPDPSMQFSAFPPQSPTMVLDPALGGQLPNGMPNGLDTLAMAAAKREDHF